MQNAVECTVSLDGSYHYRGKASDQGLVTAISPDTHEVIDRHFMSKTCRDCDKWKGKEDTLEYLIWSVCIPYRFYVQFIEFDI